ncbi:uncharacterized protein [Dermacentor albipictus]|uniref:uncharacterized protein n=1 Tax=Dermacentor albipictus TaxID=60249 RepID=UPI0038FCF027
MHVDAKEACLLLDCALESGYGSLDKVAEAVLVCDAEAVLRSDAFLSSRLETVHLVLDKVTDVREIVIIRAVLKWARSFCKAGTTVFKTTIAAFMPKLRFLALPSSVFVQFITSEDLQGVMEKEDALAILCNLVHEGCAELPEWVCRENVSRGETMTDDMSDGDRSVFSDSENNWYEDYD